MKFFYTLLFASLLAFSTSNVLAQTGPCSLSGVSNYIDFTSSSTIMMNVSVNGISQYTYTWNDGTPVGSSSQKPFYSGFCVTITDLMTGCDTTICESCIPTGGVGMCTMIYAPVCGCDGNIYSNDCIAMYNGIFTYSSAIGPNGQLLPCAVPLPSWDCVNGACVDPGTGLGAYTSLGACNIACVAVTPSWDCSSFGCYDPGTGQGAFSDYFICDSICALVVPSWDCTIAGCVDPGTGLGQYTTQANCQSMCIPTAPSWDCINGACIDPGTGLGAYNSLGVCNSACSITQSWDCIAGQGCIDPGTGQGAYTSLVTCNSSCAITPSWDCDGMGTCTDPGTGAGMYASQASCDSACIVNGVEEQTTNKKLLKITDLLGRETKGFKNEVLFYIYDDGTVEKRIVIE
jgi:hypothetical protein